MKYNSKEQVHFGSVQRTISYRFDPIVSSIVYQLYWRLIRRFDQYLLENYAENVSYICGTCCLLYFT